MSMTRVHVVRHGEVHNPGGVLYGRLPGFRLSAVGEAMAERIGEVMAQRPITQLVSSPLERARQTIAPLAGRLDLPVRLDDRAIEAGNCFEGMTVGVGEGILKRPRYWRHLRNPFRPSWGEPYVEIAERMGAALRDLAAQAEGSEALLVSHQLPIWTLRSSVEGNRLWHDPRRRQCALASVTTFVFSDGRVVAVSYAEPAADLMDDGQAVGAGA